MQVINIDRNSIKHTAIFASSAIALLMIFTLSGCGTTAPLVRSEPTALESPPQDLSAFKRVVVLDFEDRVSASVPTKEREDKAREMELGSKHFADMIAKELDSTIQGIEVVREDSPDLPATLVVSGEITRLKKGNAAARLLIGFGAGSSHFDATVRVSDGPSGADFGTIMVDKNSWALGGGIASSQSVESFMEGAAKKVATELQAAGLGKPL